PQLNFTAPFDFSTVLCGGISCAGQSGLNSMTVNVGGIGDVIFSITGNTFSVTNNSIVTSGGNGTTLTVTLPVLVLAFGSSIAPSSGVSLITINVVGDTTYDNGGPVPLSGPDYFGARTTTSFSSVTYSLTFGGLNISNFEIGTAGGSSGGSAPE